MKNIAKLSLLAVVVAILNACNKTSNIDDWEFSGYNRGSCMLLTRPYKSIDSEAVAYSLSYDINKDKLSSMFHLGFIPSKLIRDRYSIALQRGNYPVDKPNSKA